MATPTVWDVPAITPGTPQARVFQRAFPYAMYPWRNVVEIYNHTSGELITVRINGSEVVLVAAGDSRIVDWVKEIRDYTVDATGATVLGEIEVTESGGLDQP